jgi:hypothetical protein
MTHDLESVALALVAEDMERVTIPQRMQFDQPKRHEFVMLVGVAALHSV